MGKFCRLRCPCWQFQKALKLCTFYPNHNNTVLANFQFWHRSSSLISGSLKIKIFSQNHCFRGVFFFFIFCEPLYVQSKIQRGWNWSLQYFKKLCVGWNQFQIDLASFGRPKGVESGPQAKTYHFCASFLNHTGSVKKTQKLAYVSIFSIWKSLTVLTKSLHQDCGLCYLHLQLSLILANSKGSKKFCLI